VLYLVRHGHAGNKHAWRGSDLDRPLSATGRREAEGLVVLLRDLPVGTIVSSPAVRCSQTVQPLAAARRLPVRVEEFLVVGAENDEVLARLFESEPDEVLWCTHGEVIGDLLGSLRRKGAPIGERAVWPKGSVWLLEVAGGRVRGARYLPPRRQPPPGEAEAGRARAGRPSP
jgi:broad specificity phosphatase PhoE